jgi:tetratricopeptide (TPR) repeat protein
MWLMLSMMALTGAALAQDAPDEARVLHEQGLKYYQQGNYSMAIQLWERTYELTPLPPILHNVAKAREESGDPRAALETWRRYVEVAPAEERPAAQARIAALEVVVETLAQTAEPAPEPAPAAATLPPPLPEPRREPRSYRGLAVGLLGVGATGAVASGGWLAAQAQRRASEAALGGCVVYGESTLCDESTRDQLGQGRLQLALGAALVGGGLALGGGGVLIALRPGQDGADIALSGEW